MLTGYQTETVAFYHEGEIIHDHCARELFGTLSVEKADRGLTNAYGLDPIIRYTLDELVYEQATEYVSEGGIDWATDPKGYDDAVEALIEQGYPCDHCGEGIS